jgi:hypothetical protein
MVVVAVVPDDGGALCVVVAASVVGSSVELGRPAAPTEAPSIGADGDGPFQSVPGASVDESVDDVELLSVDAMASELPGTVAGSAAGVAGLSRDVDSGCARIMKLPTNNKPTTAIADDMAATRRRLACITRLESKACASIKSGSGPDPARSCRASSKSSNSLIAVSLLREEVSA